MTEANLVRAKAARDERMKGPLAISARYDADRDRIVIMLTTGVEVHFVPAMVQGLGGAAAAEPGTV